MANTLTFLGYQPVWQDVFSTETGDLRVLLSQQIDQCKGVVQLVGQCYGAEPPTADEECGRTSYTQYEALYARKRGKNSGCSRKLTSWTLTTTGTEQASGAVY